MPLLRKELREFVEEHNVHRIRKQRGKKTPQGFPRTCTVFLNLRVWLPFSSRLNIQFGRELITFQDNSKQLITKGIPFLKRVLVFLTGFKQAGYQLEQSDLDYLRQEQGLGENLPDYITADFRRAADNFLTLT